MPTTECEHGMPTPASCYDCMEDGVFVRAPERPAPHVVARFEARHDGQCPACNLGIHVGQEIVKLADGTYEHGHHHDSHAWSTEGH